MGLMVQFPVPPRFSRRIVNRVALVLAILAIFQHQHLYLIYRDALIAKYFPTDFGIKTDEALGPLMLPVDEDEQLLDDLKASRAEWRVLGKGAEGKTFVYKRAVIKTYTPGRSPFRNCAPGVPGEKWPTEIPATWRYGGAHDPHGQANLTFDGFLPVLSYFKASPSPSAPVEWHLVTPLLEGGSLGTLAKRQHKQQEIYGEIDNRYRPAFNRLLLSLESLHKTGFCHDDVKPANILVKDDSQFILGDLGNLRQLTHPYHSSRLWYESNQLADCRANDVFRMLKSYLAFIREAAKDTEQFDMDFFEAKESLSRLFWWTSIHKFRITAAKLRTQSDIYHSQQPPLVSKDEDLCPAAPSSSLLGILSTSWKLSVAVNRFLQIRLADAAARWWALVWLFGVPVSDVCGA